MKHSIRQHIINAQGFKTTKVIKVEGELGSGVLDKNGREIFEGDIVEIDGGGKYCVDIVNFWVKDLDEFYSDALEVVGHAED